MNNDVTQQIQYYSPNISNPVVAATVLGIVLITVNAKYNRNVELAYKDLSLKAYSPAPIVTAVPVQS